MTLTYLSLGGNLNNPELTLPLAIETLKKHPWATLVANSSYYLSAPIDAIGNDYINCAICIKWQTDAVSLLETCLKIEKQFGRERSSKNAPRTLDIDILLFGEKQFNEINLCIPHPQLTRRAFVLIPLLEINPDISIPGKGKAKDFLITVRNQVISKI